jgi:hypothetical protein
MSTFYLLLFEIKGSMWYRIETFSGVRDMRILSTLHSFPLSYVGDIKLLDMYPDSFIIHVHI